MKGLIIMNKYLIPVASVLALATASAVAAQSTSTTTTTSNGIGADVSVMAKAQKDGETKGIGADVSAKAHARNATKAESRTGTKDDSDLDDVATSDAVTNATSTDASLDARFRAAITPPRALRQWMRPPWPPRAAQTRQSRTAPARWRACATAFRHRPMPGPAVRRPGSRQPMPA